MVPFCLNSLYFYESYTRPKALPPRSQNLTPEFLKVLLVCKLMVTAEVDYLAGYSVFANKQVIHEGDKTCVEPKVDVRQSRLVILPLSSTALYP